MANRALAALSAVIRYEKAAAMVAANRKAISESLAKCPVNAEMDKGWGTIGFDEKKFTDGKYVRTHLHEVMKEQAPCDSGYGDRRLEDHEIEEALEEGGCEHCLAAWRFVRLRRDARREFGIAKRVVRAIGRKAIEETP